MGMLHAIFLGGAGGRRTLGVARGPLQETPLQFQHGNVRIKSWPTVVQQDWSTSSQPDFVHACGRRERVRNRQGKTLYTELLKSWPTLGQLLANSPPHGKLRGLPCNSPLATPEYYRARPPNPLLEASESGIGLFSAHFLYGTCQGVGKHNGVFFGGSGVLWYGFPSAALCHSLRIDDATTLHVSVPCRVQACPEFHTSGCMRLSALENP